MNRSTPGLPVHCQLPEFNQTQRPLSQWCHPAISSSVIPFSSCPQSLPASESFPMSQPFAVICNVLLLVWKEKELLFPSNCVYFLGGAWFLCLHFLYSQSLYLSSEGFPPPHLRKRRVRTCHRAVRHVRFQVISLSSFGYKACTFAWWPLQNQTKNVTCGSFPKLSRWTDYSPKPGSLNNNEEWKVHFKSWGGK